MKNPVSGKLLLALLALPAAAASAQSAPAGAEAAAGLSAAELFAMGGWMMYALAAVSVVGVSLVFYYLFALRTGRVAPEALAIRLRELLNAGRVREAKELCRANRSSLARVAASALAFRAENPAAGTAAVKEVMESEGARQGAKMQEAVHYLADIAAVAPMVGLLGTVMGMLKAFNSVAFDVVKARPMELAGGVGQALVTTIAGLLVAIPAVVMYAVFRGRVSSLVGKLEVASAGLLHVLAKGAPAEGAPEGDGR